MAYLSFHIHKRRSVPFSLNSFAMEMRSIVLNFLFCFLYVLDYGQKAMHLKKKSIEDVVDPISRCWNNYIIQPVKN